MPDGRTGKKLIDAAVFWINQGSRRSQGNNESLSDAIAFGAPPEVIEQMRVHQEKDDAAFEVLEENVPIIEAFLIVCSQFSRSGFRYEGVKAGLSMAGIRHKKKIFHGLRVMESAILSELHRE